MPSSDVEGHRAFKAMVTHSELTIPPLRTPRWTEKTAIFFSAGITSTSFLQHDAVSIEFTVTITSHASDSAVQCANVTSDDYGTSPISHHIMVSLEYKQTSQDDQSYDGYDGMDTATNRHFPGLAALRSAGRDE